MSRDPEGPVGQEATAGVPLGVMDAVGMGWRLMMGDFWHLWLVGLLAFIIEGFSGPAAIVVGPPVMAGLFYAIGRRASGASCEVTHLFEGFKRRFGQSILAMLPAYLGMFVALAIDLVVVFGLLGLFGVIGAVVAGEGNGDQVAGAIFGTAFLVVMVVHVGLILAMNLWFLFFVFAPRAVWDHEESGWEAAWASLRLVKDHLWSMIGFFLLFAAIGLVAVFAGYITCCVGFLFFIPAITVWQYAALLYLYRSWTGQALVQPVVQASPTAGAPGGAGPIPPSDIQPPAGV